MFEVSEPSRQQKWVRIRQEVTRTPEEGRGDLGQATFSCCFPLRIQVQLVISWRISLIFFSCAFRQTAGNHGPQMVLGTTVWWRSSSQSAPVAVGIVAARSALAEPLGKLRYFGCFVGCAWRVLSAAYSL